MKQKQYDVQVFDKKQLVFETTVKSIGTRQAIQNVITNRYRRECDEVRAKLKDEAWEDNNMAMEVVQKVQVTSAQFDALMEAKSQGMSAEDLMTAIINNQLTSPPVMRSLQDMKFTDIVLAMEVRGFEVKRSPEQLIKQLHDHIRSNLGDEDPETALVAEASQDTLEKVLGYLGIKIEGVNA